MRENYSGKHLGGNGSVGNSIQHGRAPKGRSTLSQRISPEMVTRVVENRLSGMPDDQIMTELVNEGISPALVQREMNRLRHDPCYVAAERLVQRLNKLKSVLNVRHALSGLSSDASSIERRSNISSNEFLERYYAANRPVILTGLLAHTPARKRWTPEYLAEVCGNATVQIMAGRQADPCYEINLEAHRREIKMSEYVRMVLEGGSSNDYYLVANNGFFGLPDTGALFDEVPQLPKYLDHADSRQKVFLWFGPAGTITPLHHDVMNVLVAQIYGRKRFTLIPPEHTPYVYNEVGVYSDVDCGKPDYVRHPLFKQARPISLVLNPGEVLFLPVGWWHYVKTLEVSIMVSYINFCFPNEYEWFHPHLRQS